MLVALNALDHTEFLPIFNESLKDFDEAEDEDARVRLAYTREATSIVFFCLSFALCLWGGGWGGDDAMTLAGPLEGAAATLATWETLAWAEEAEETPVGAAGTTTRDAPLRIADNRLDIDVAIEAEGGAEGAAKSPDRYRKRMEDEVLAAAATRFAPIVMLRGYFVLALLRGADGSSSWSWSWSW